MDLRTYLNEQPRGSGVALAAKLGISPVYLTQLTQRRDGRVPSAELCVQIEKDTGGAVTRKDLRPDDWHAIWPELVAANTPRQKARA